MVEACVLFQVRALKPRSSVVASSKHTCSRLRHEFKRTHRFTGASFQIRARANYLIVNVTVTLPPSALLVSEMMFLAWL